MSRRVKRIVLMIVDALLIVAANEMAFFFVDRYVSLTGTYLALTILAEVIVYSVIANATRVFSKINRYTSIKDVWEIVVAVTSAFLLVGIGLFITRVTYSLRHLILTYLFSLLFIAGCRFVWRFYVESRLHNHNVDQSETVTTILVGAGDGARVLLDRLSYDQPSVDVIGLVDDDPDKQKTWIHDTKVLGKLVNLPELIAKYNVKQVTVAIPSLQPAGYEKLLSSLKDSKVKVNRMPKLDDILSDHSNAGQLEDIDVADLLERPEVKLDMTQISSRIAGKVIMVTGAGGSIGSEIVRQVSKFQPKQVLLLGHGENSIYMITREIRKSYPGNIDFVPLIGDVQDRKLMFSLMANYHPDIVYHAAAHKHVPLMEYNPHEAVKNNVFGTKNVADAAKAANVKNFVMVSTDKAVNSTSVMGSTKRMAEMIVTSENEAGHTKFAVVRFGNVLGSRGSVVPLFKRQIKAGGPLTITDKRMTRYFMTIPEASRLVIQAGALSKGGELFILDMGKPVKILDLAKKIIRLSGHTEAEIGIKEVGMRPGEKLYEELVTEAEATHEKVYDKISLGHVSQYDTSKIMTFAEHLLTLSDQELSQEIVTYSNHHNGQEKAETSLEGVN